MKSINCCVALSAVALLSSCEKKIERPNVVFIYADDMGKGMLSAFGQKYIQTPNIDKLFTDGLQFDNAYGGHYSAPARAMLLTGYSDCRADKWNIAKGGQFASLDTTKIAAIERKIDSERVALPDNDQYLAEIFKQAGYVTGQVGKLGYSFASTRADMVRQGWDYYCGYLDHTRCHGFYPPFLFDTGSIEMIEGNTFANCAKSKEPYDIKGRTEERMDRTGKAQYSQDIFNVKIREFLRENKDRPFFLYNPTQLPHGPLSAPYIHEQVADIEELTHGEKEYATMMILLDEAVGMIMEELEALGIADKTMIIFSADNGHEVYTATGASRRTSKTRDLSQGKALDNLLVKYRSEACGDIFDGNMGMAGIKRSNLNGGVSVPLTYYLPGVIEAGVVRDIVANYDMCATMADMLGVEICEEKDSKSYLSLLRDPKGHLESERVVVVDSFEGPMIVRNDGWKIRYSPVIKGFELFNIFEDRAEYNNLAEEHPQIVEALREELRGWDEQTMCRGDYVN